MAEKSSFALIIPCYNEEKAIPPFQRELLQFRDQFQAQFPEIELGVIFVNNNSTDQSASLLHKMVKESVGIQVINCPKQGYGAALKAGFSSVNATWYSFADLDNTYPLQDIITMFTLLRDQNLDIVYANRLRLQTGMPFLRRLGNLFYSGLSQLFFQNSIHDMCSGLRVFTAQRLPQILKLKSEGLNFSIEFTAVCLKQKWPRSEFNIQYRERIGPSKLSVIQDGFAFLFVLIRVRLIK
ncbi:MAG: hypothetical protein A2622_10525 [Bdellovibrionales bacterium RIFCSPHIGHO2_01_FULL_40_29]|nr:MAG: hypothetical protein A2622_10525 [Bdellovibrionales bacterium RIFCSPHIGHO2_01_FULL_40_29]OFZ34394.1 MAG: hypothetical protein A3D17_00790 [Bdellovibrionales bacterium RIFCSPHIGHO2_02_FULL_40_15]